MLPTDNSERKALPLYDFMFGYFPLAWLEVVKVAVAGNGQHNPGEPLHWAREKSTDQLNTAFRHLFDHGCGTIKDTDGCYHLAKTVWRLMAQIQLLREQEQAHDAGRPCEDEGGHALEEPQGFLQEACAEWLGLADAGLSRPLSGVRVPDRDQGPRETSDSETMSDSA